MANAPKVDGPVTAADIQQARAEQLRVFLETFGPVTEDSSPEVKEVYAQLTAENT